MTTTSSSPFPKLRAVDTRGVMQGGRPYIFIRDPLRLTDQTVLVPQSVAPILALCDGTRDARAISAALAVRLGQSIPPDEIEKLLAALDEALLLDNERSAQAREQVLLEFRQAPFRSPVLAGESYPADKSELQNLLQGYLDAVDTKSFITEGCGLVSPHIDYGRGAEVYAHVWGRAAEVVRAAELVIILGTDHFSDDDRITLTHQHYATPFGVLPTAREIVDQLAEAIGKEVVFAGELHHRSEHSIELAATWLHHIREGQPCEILPILCGFFSSFIKNQSDPESDPIIQKLLSTLKSATAGRRNIVVAAGDLSHVGPAFGGHPLDLVSRARLQSADDELIELICAGDAEGFFQAIKRVQDRNNVCGLAPIYLALELLSPVQGEHVAYARCPADEQGTSVVSICGIVFK